MVNDDVVDLYRRVNVGAKVVGLPQHVADAYARVRFGALAVAATRLRSFAPHAQHVEEPAMNHSILTCGRTTHLKIVAVALITAVLCATVGLKARRVRRQSPQALALFGPQRRSRSLTLELGAYWGHYSSPRSCRPGGRRAKRGRGALRSR